MFRNYVKCSIRNLIKNRSYSLLNIFGLSIGLAAFTLIALFVRHELSYDRYNKDFDRIYRVVRNEYTCSPPPMASTLKAKIPEIEFSSKFILSKNALMSVGEHYFTEDEYFWTDNEFFSIFSFDFVQGNAKTALTNPGDVIISESIARKYFGYNEPMGKTITISRKHKYSVAGVFKDLPNNSHFEVDIILPIDQYFETTNANPENWGSNYVYTYIKLNQQTAIANVNDKLIDIEKKLTGWTAESGEPYEQYFSFQPIQDIHLYSHRQQEVQVNGDIKNVYIFSSIGLLILVIAGINYINLSTAMSSKRHKEVGIRKALGAHKSQLVYQFLTESVMIALIATLTATIVVYNSQGYFGNLMARKMSISLTDVPFLLPSLFLLAIVVGLAAGLIPSKSVSAVNIVSILRKSSTNIKGGGNLRNILVVLQFSIALVLIVLSINVQRQLAFIMDKDPGYEKEQILTMKLFDRSIGKNIGSIKKELATNRNILDISASYNLPHEITEFRQPEWFCKGQPNCVSISYNPVDYDFVNLYDLEILKGRNFSKDYPSDAQGAFIVNEKAIKMAGWDDPIGLEISHYNGTKGKIIGVVKDFHFQSMHSEIAPLYLMLDENAYAYLSIKILGKDVSATLNSIRDVFDQYSPNAPFQYTFFDVEFEQTYHSEKRLGSVFTFFSMLAILLGCLGLYGMSTFSIAQKTKEIGIRKVLGATNFGIILKLGKNFLKPVVFANLLAWPIAYLSVKNWLESFAFRTDITIWSFLLAASLVLVITLLTIILQSKKISDQSPTTTLKYE